MVKQIECLANLNLNEHGEWALPFQPTPHPTHERIITNGTETDERE
tara:strand:+ start:14833 stop:14970 length:138 start_codon:yes stop_codon:yes gene_type:complete